MKMLPWLGSLAFAAVSTSIVVGSQGHFHVSGIYPHLAMFNHERECGTGAVVPWAGRLWVITYAPHMPGGSSDKLYEITPDLHQIIRPESIGGTPANRLIHRESQQLFIGPYAIDAQRNVRVIAYTSLYGRPTGTARHLLDPANKVYTATMEEGFYEVDVQTLAVTELFRDEQISEPFRRANLPGYHGKGLYSGQGVLVYANNGENSPLAREKPDIPSGALATWDGRSDTWDVVRRNQFTEVTGPGGLTGNNYPGTDPIWSVGWDHRSLILAVLHAGRWHSYRLPKASHSYDGAHGWNTEWPRIRDIGEDDLLMTMHGTFWRFPRGFTPGASAGLAPRSTYLKVVGDFTRWGEWVVLGCDDTAASEFLNTRRSKGDLAAPGQSQSNLVFLQPAALDGFGPALGRGAVWLDEAVRANAPSDAFLFAGYDQRGLHLAHQSDEDVEFRLEVDRYGTGNWELLQQVLVPPRGYRWIAFEPNDRGAWIRLRALTDVSKATAMFAVRNQDRRSAVADARFAGLARSASLTASAGLLHARGADRRTLGFAVHGGSGADPSFYELGADMVLRANDEPGAGAWIEKNVAIPADAISHDQASALYLDEQGRRFRLPRAREPEADDAGWGVERAVREVCTERDLLNCSGTFFELPAENAGGIRKVRPIATHLRRIHDFASWRGLLVMSGVDDGEASDGRHLIRSSDGRAALWVGSVDDLWSFGKPRGEGGPWKDSAITALEWSDPYLMSGYDKKSIELGHRSDHAVRLRVQIDVSGDGHWFDYQTFDLAPGGSTRHEFPDEFEAYWVRIQSDASTVATAWLTYE
jgi:hypothetical protein